MLVGYTVNTTTSVGAALRGGRRGRPAARARRALRRAGAGHAARRHASRAGGPCADGDRTRRRGRARRRASGPASTYEDRTSTKP